MSLTLWHNPRCSKSRQTLALLEARGVAFETRLYLDEPPTLDELRAIVARLDVPVKQLVRRKEAKEADIVHLEGDELLRGLIAHPRAIQRPILVSATGARLGRPPEHVLGLLEA
jgi:arsenate reductase